MGEEQDWSPEGSLVTAAQLGGKTVTQYAHMECTHAHTTLPLPTPHHNGQLWLFLLLSDTRGHQSGPRLHEGRDETSLCTQLVVVGGHGVPESIDLRVNRCKQRVCSRQEGESQSYHDTFVKALVAGLMSHGHLVRTSQGVSQ